MSENLAIFLQKAEECRVKYEKIIKSLQDPDVIKDRKKMIALSQEKKSLENVILPFNEYKNVASKIKEDEKILS